MKGVKEQNFRLLIILLYNINFIVMTKLQVKAFVFQLLCFAGLFILFRYLISEYTNLTGLWIPFTAFVVGTLLAPKFQAVKTNDGEKLFMKWLFVKGIREIK